MSRHRVLALALPETVAFDLSIPAQVFGHPDESHYSFALCTQHPGEVPTTTGFSISVPGGLEACTEADTIVVPGFMPTDDPPEPVLEALRDAHDRGARIVSVCVGVFALAAAGLLDGRGAAVHWQHAPDLRRRFPAVDVRPEVLYVDEGDVLSSAGIAAGIDLCLHLVDVDWGAEVAHHVSRRMVAALHRTGGQAQYMERMTPESVDLLSETLEWASRRLDRQLTVREMAHHAGYSPRGFSRIFHRELGVSPMRWMAQNRVAEARRLLEATDLPIDEVAARSGLGSAANLRSHFAREVATTPTAYRHAYRG